LQTGNVDDDWNVRPSTDSWRPRAGNEYSDNPPPVDAQEDINRSDKPTGYGMEKGVPIKQDSVDQAYLEHPSKAYTDDPDLPPPVPEKQFFAPPSNPPPSYGMQEPGQALSHPAEGSMGRKTPKQDSSISYPQQQPYDPYYPPIKS